MEEEDEITTLMAKFKLTQECCSQQITEEHIYDISFVRGVEWKYLSHLKLSRQKLVHDIERKTGVNEDEKRHDYFSQWRDEKGSEATYGVLIEALLKAKSKLDAEYVCKLLQPSSEKKEPTSIIRSG
jgi:hypothetical protein